MKYILLIALTMFVSGCHLINVQPLPSKSNYTVHIIHGFGATPNDHWFKWLENRLIAEGYQVDNIALPHSNHPNFTQWQNTLYQHIGTPDSHDIFIAHSLGNISLLHYLSQSNSSCIGGLVLTSGFENKLPQLPVIDGFNVDNYVNQASVNHDEIKKLTPNIYSIISDNDYIVAPTESLKLASNLDSRVFTIHQGGHLLATDGYNQLPIALNLINQIVENRTKPSCN
ncbi:RBBP9/YdeN family alpha/beta hydrolase [Moraxella osloensis]|nr:alpha/beta hydrolase [Moraxella osloensis]MCK6052594.1 alpha/beta hydrolase [Moraxella osloensis]